MLYAILCYHDETFTGSWSKEHDDAVHAEADPDPKNAVGFIVDVAIADVAFYVRPGSALDHDALTSGN